MFADTATGRDDNINRETTVRRSQRANQRAAADRSRDAKWTRERGERDCPTVNVCLTRLLRDYVRRGASDGAAKSRRQTIHSYLRLFEHVRT